MRDTHSPLDSGPTTADLYALLEAPQRPELTLVEMCHTPFKYVFTLLIIGVVITAGTAFLLGAMKAMTLPSQAAVIW